MGKRGPSWDDDEEDFLLNGLEEHLPINPTEWNTVLLHHQERYARRTLAAIQRRFNELARTTEPTGDPNIPPVVQRAKGICDVIMEKADGTTGSPGDDKQLGSDEEEDEVIDNILPPEDEGEQLVDFFNPDPTVVSVGGRVGGGNAAAVSRGGGGGNNSRRGPSPVVAGFTAAAAPAISAAASASVASDVPRSSPKFATSIDIMKRGGGYSSRKGEDGFSMQNMFGMMMMSQQSDRQMNREKQEMERELERERHAFQIEQWRIDREDRAREAREAREERNQQQQMMTMMMMSMMGKKEHDTSNKWGEHRIRKRGRTDDDNSTSDSDDEKNNLLAGLFVNLLESRLRRVISNLFDGMIAFRFQDNN